MHKIHPSIKSINLFVVQDGGLELVVIGAAERQNGSAVLDEHERRHRRDVVLHRDLLVLVNVHLQEHHVAVLLGELLQFRRDHLARAAPRGEEVDHDQVAAGVLQFLLQVSLQHVRFGVSGVSGVNYATVTRHVVGLGPLNRWVMHFSIGTDGEPEAPHPSIGLGPCFVHKSPLMHYHIGDGSI